MRENSIFTITPPDMRLSEDGPTITVISTDKDFVDYVEAMYEKMFKTVPVTIYLTDGVVTEDKLAWLLSVMRFSETVFVDLATASDISILSSVMVDVNRALINTDGCRNDIAKVFNALGENAQVHDSIEDYFEFMLLVSKM